MERSDMSSNVGKIKEKWKYSSGFTASLENTVPFEGVSCVARNVYTCSFCKRKFKSAQALGGHMNVHRRERARLRLLPNPNPSPTMASSVLSLSTSFSTKYVPCNANPSVMASTDHTDKKKLIVFDFDHVTVDDHRIFKVFKTENSAVRLDLEMSLFKDSKDQDVDLELRLGYL